MALLLGWGYNEALVSLDSECHVAWFGFDGFDLHVFNYLSIRLRYSWRFTVGFAVSSMTENMTTYCKCSNSSLWLFGMNITSRAKNATLSTLVHQNTHSDNISVLKNYRYLDSVCVIVTLQPVLRTGLVIFILYQYSKHGGYYKQIILKRRSGLVNHNHALEYIRKHPILGSWLFLSE